MLIAIQTTMEKVAVAFLFQPLPCGDLFKYQYCKSVLPVVKSSLEILRAFEKTRTT